MHPTRSVINNSHYRELNENSHSEVLPSISAPENVNKMCNDTLNKKLIPTVSSGTVYLVNADVQVEIVRKYVLAVRKDTQIDIDVAVTVPDASFKRGPRRELKPWYLC